MSDNFRSVRRACTAIQSSRMRGEGVLMIGVVDDDEAMRAALSSLLRSVGHRSVEFASAEEFLQGRLDEMDCLVLDIRLPGLSGLELQRCLTETGNTVPIIFVTARTDAVVREEALQGGAIAFLPKPFSDGALLGAIDSGLKSRREQNEGKR